MPNQIRNIHTVDEKSFPYVFEQNVSIPLKTSSGLVRCNVFRPQDADGEQKAKYPVLVTYGPYGKDIYYGDFHPKSFDEVNAEHKSPHSAWEVPDPGFWTSHGYAVVRADERGLGQSPGTLDTMSRGTSEAFFEVVEWAAEQPWSSGKVGLLGISYYAGSQWRVAAQQPKGLSAIIPWEGMSDYYRDRCRQGGILSNEFVRFWWTRQVVSNQYGKGGRAARKWGPDTIEGDLTEEELKQNRNDQNIDNASNHFRDQRYYASKEYNKEDIVVPLLSVANWGGITLHLRGNVEGYLGASSKFKYLRFITGRHDLPFYYHEEVEIQKSFLDAFLKGEDRVGWSVEGKLAPVDIVLRKGDVGHNDAKAEMAYPRRTENEWPIARTQYTPYYLTPEGGLTPTKPHISSISKATYEARGFKAAAEIPMDWNAPTDVSDKAELVQFTTAEMRSETEVTGHLVAHLNVSVTSTIPGISPSEIDIFVTLRHISAEGKEVFYTGTAGNPVPLCKGWLRVSLRKVNTAHPNHREWLPHRDYFSSDVLPVIPGEVYPVDVEIWPTNVILDKGSKLVFEVASADTQGCERFKHTEPTDRPEEKLAGKNHIHFGAKYSNYVTLPIIPPK